MINIDRGIERVGDSTLVNKIENRCAEPGGLCLASYRLTVDLKNMTRFAGSRGISPDKVSGLTLAESKGDRWVRRMTSLQKQVA